MENYLVLTHLKTIVGIAIAAAALVACGSDDDPNGPVPDTALTSSIWTVTKAETSNGQAVQPITKLIDEGKPALLRFDHGFFAVDHGVYRDDGFARDNVCQSEPYGYVYSDDALIYKFRDFGPNVSVNCGEEYYAVGLRFIELFSPGARWEVSSTTPPVLTLVDTDGTVFSLTGSQP